MARQIVQRATGDQTRERILDVAEKLFAAAGFDAVSMRQVGTEAEVPFALVSYHFGSKLGLYKAVFARRSGVISTQRLDSLKAIELVDDVTANMMAIAHALVDPLLNMRETEGGSTFSQLLAREIHDPVEGGRGIVEEYFDPIAQVTIDLLRRAVPSAPEQQAYYAYFFSVGTLSTNLAGTGRLDRLSGGKHNFESASLIDGLDRYIAGGLIAILCPGALLGNQS